MSITRIYTGKDGQSHIEELDLAAHPELTALIAAKHAVFRSAQPGPTSDWHNPSGRHIIITLSGEAEFGFGDGTVYRVGPGNANLIEDCTGKGHTMRTIGNQPRISLKIQLSD